jgi:hypothetical protein
MIQRHSAALLTAIKAEKRSKNVPESDKISQTETQTKLFLVLFVLSRGESSLMVGMGRSF